MDIVSIIISTTLELPTLENGAIRIAYPTLLTPIVTGHMTAIKNENGGKSEETGYYTYLLLINIAMYLFSYSSVHVFSLNYPCP